jgi:DNA-binding response OmpR family regulator/anti-sigma regulatory factor (Ser/Thr protein kinase)
MKILIIEDESAIRETLKDILELNGYTILAAADGPAGVTLAAHGPDIIFCDIGLPGMDGFQVLTAIRALPSGRDVPFVFLTARSDRSDQRRGMGLGADDYITKPFTEREILDAIQARVHRQQPLRDRLAQLLDERRSELGAQWSHELMTPLNGVLGGLELIEAEVESIDPSELKELLGLIRAGAERQHALSRKLVLYFELERLRGSPPAKTPRGCARDGIATGAQRAAQAEKRLADISVRAEPAFVRLNEAHLAAAVEELVANALRFSKAGQPVTVVGTAREGRYLVEVTDCGPGMTADQRAQVAAFRQFDRPKFNQQGLGLGLAIARSAAELAGGRLQLEPVHSDQSGLRATLDLVCS